MFRACVAFLVPSLLGCGRQTTTPATPPADHSSTAGLLYPLTGLLISPVWASVAMRLSSLSVVSNTLRLRRITL